MGGREEEAIEGKEKQKEEGNTKKIRNNTLSVHPPNHPINESNCMGHRLGAIMVEDRVVNNNWDSVRARVCFLIF